MYTTMSDRSVKASVVRLNSAQFGLTRTGAPVGGGDRTKATDKRAPSMQIIRKSPFLRLSFCAAARSDSVGIVCVCVVRLFMSYVVRVDVRLCM